MASKSKRSGDKKPSKSKSKTNYENESSSEEHQSRRKHKRKHSEEPKSKSQSKTSRTSDSNNSKSQSQQYQYRSGDSTGNITRASANLSSHPFAESSTIQGINDSNRNGDFSSESWDTEPNGKEMTPDVVLQMNTENVHSQLKAMAANADSSTLETKGSRNEELNLNYSSSSYPAWRTKGNCKPPITTDEIATLFKRMSRIFGFQKDNVRNMFDHLMVLLDSRASRMGMNRALVSLHADYIGGENANYRKWYFAAQIDIFEYSQQKESINTSQSKENSKIPDSSPPSKLKYDAELEAAMEQWRNKMANMSTEHRISQVILYLLCWGEANQVRFMPECLAFIFMCANEYYHSLETPRSKTSHRNDNYDDIDIEQPTASVNTDATTDGKWKEYPEFYYLDTIITPFYEILRNQVYEKVNGQYIRKEKDHSKVIGYDDINQLFWHKEGLERLKLANGQSLTNLPLHEWYPNLCQVKWEKAFYKTYCETRSWLHMMINFNRIWIIHVSMFWFYTAFNSPSLYTIEYDYTKNNQPPSHVRWSIVAMGAAIGPLVNIIATISEYMFVPRKFPGVPNLLVRLIILFIAFALMVAPTCYILLKRPLNSPDTVGISIAIVQMAVAIVFTIFFSITPLGSLFGLIFPRDKGRKHLATKFFVCAFYQLRGNDRLISYGLWISILVAKLTESYFFLTLSLRDPIRELSVLNLSNCLGDVYLGPHLCRQQARIIMFGMFVTDLVLFFLDSYLWYIIFNTLFSVARSFYLGVSIWTPWRNIYSRLPKRIYSKILCTQNIPSNKYRSKKLVSEIWNIIIRAMYSQHLIPIEQHDKLIFKSEVSPKSGEAEVVEPTFFVSQEDQAFHSSIFEAQSEAERRISFFAQSLATPIPETYPIENMPSFTVLIPHYREKIMLAIREVIRGDDQNARISLLEYLKQLHPLEWNCFVEDTKQIVDITALPGGDDEKNHNGLLSEIPFYCIGFKSSETVYVDRTRIWASIRAQTLYRTISGFMNYAKAIKLLYMVENRQNLSSIVSGNYPSSSSSSSSSTTAAQHRHNRRPEKESDSKDEKDQWAEQESFVNKVVNRKFRLLVSMQRLLDFNQGELEDTEKLLDNFKQLKIAYLDKKPPLQEGGDPIYYSVLIDHECEIMADGKRSPMYRIRLSGDPILGDGKGDNQNHALIFYRGEYIQLVDANQDNYLEECLKIRSVLAEFEEMSMPQDPYIPSSSVDNGATTNSGDSGPQAPVAILGAREYVFSENIGVLGDVAAGKEQTFGTLFARTLAKIGGKLHYGHPDFLNGIFMTTRGGVSKAQKGLHLNEDIYAGMTAILRGGRIKHSEYIQCGKGRDLGFGSILNFTSKIGAGMGEQMLSREYYYLGTRLPLDRFLSFYYAHPGFHINNMFIVVSLELFLIVMLNLSALAGETVICYHDPNSPKTDPHHPPGCQNLIPLFKWVERCVLSIFVVFFISFLPLFVQELTERGFWRSATRLGKHLLSLSPIFEVFVCQIYAQSLTYDLSLGGARYISTGRGFATSRVPFATLFMRFATTSMYFGARSFIILLFISITSWKVSLLWFLVTTIALCLAPVIYNPHQFAMSSFFLDYRDFVRWLFRGSTKYHGNSWISYVRENRARITGYKRKSLYEDSDTHKESSIPKLLNIIMSEVIVPFMVALSVVVPYLYVNSQNDIRALRPYSNPIIRLGICTLGPMILDGLVVLIIFFLACCASPLFRLRYLYKIPSGLATMTHIIAVVNHFAFFEVLWLMERWNFRRALLGLISVILLQTCIIKTITALFLTRELKHSRTNSSWWTGRWASSELGWMIITQPLREYSCKVIEMSLFALDFTLGHCIFFVQTPILLIPYIDRWHSMMLFWLRPNKQKLSERLVLPITTVTLQHRLVRKFSISYFIILLLFIASLVGPIFIPVEYKEGVADYVESYYPGIVRAKSIR